MNGTDIAAIVALVAVTIVCAATTMVLVNLSRTIGELRAEVDRLRNEAVPVLTEARNVVQATSLELERVDDVVGTAERVVRRRDTTSRLTYAAFATPLVKVAAIGTGASRGYRRFRTLRARG
ncbi:MAG: DUF948 domain-containing protein [Acidimicrobiia bacterium]